MEADIRALISDEAGGPATLRLGELPDPVASAGEVVVRVRACGINYPDVLIIEDRYQYRPDRPFSPGAEIAGEIETVGEGVTGLKPRDRVLALAGWGGLAEKISLPSAPVSFFYRRCLSTRRQLSS